MTVVARALQIFQHQSNAFLLRRVAIHEVLQHVQAVAIGQYQTLRRRPVPACTTDLLAVVFDGFGQIEMDDVADVTLVDAHPERDRGDDAVEPPLHELALNRLALIVGQAGMVGVRRDAVLRQMSGHELRSLLQRDVDNARLPGPFAEPLHQPPALVPACDRLNPQGKVCPVETGRHHIVRRDAELALHVIDDLRCRGRCQ